MHCYTNFKIVPEKKLIIEYFSGTINLDEIIKLKYLESKNPHFCPDFNIIDDSRDAEFLLNEKDIKLYIKILSNNELFVGKRNAAYLTKTPHQVVIATLFDLLKKELPLNIKIVSTIDAALQWVGILREKELVKFYLNVLKAQK